MGNETYVYFSLWFYTFDTSVCSYAISIGKKGVFWTGPVLNLKNLFYFSLNMNIIVSDNWTPIFFIVYKFGHPFNNPSWNTIFFTVFLRTCNLFYHCGLGLEIKNSRDYPTYNLTLNK